MVTRLLLLLKKPTLARSEALAKKDYYEPLVLLIFHGWIGTLANLHIARARLAFSTAIVALTEHS